MSDIILDKKIIGERCTNYAELCKALDEKIAVLEKDPSIAAVLQRAGLQTQQVFCELQIAKVQLSLRIKLTEKQIVILRNKLAKIIAIYQKLFIAKIPCPMAEVSRHIELIGAQHEEQWLKDIRMLGLAMTTFANHAKKNNSYLVTMNYQYQFAGIFRNSILCKGLRPQMDAGQHICNLRREQIVLFHRYADEQVAKQREFFALTQALECLENAVKITRAVAELGFVTDGEFFDIEFYKRLDEALTKILSDARADSKK